MKFPKYYSGTILIFFLESDIRNRDEILLRRLSTEIDDLAESERKKMLSGIVVRFCNFYSDIFVPTDKKHTLYYLESENNCC